VVLLPQQKKPSGGSDCSSHGFWDKYGERCQCDMNYIGDACQIPILWKSKEDIDRENSFKSIYDHDTWGNRESKSGDGSTIWWTASIRPFLANMIKKYDMKNMLDSPCGDFNWMQHVEFPSDFEYVGVDVVLSEIELNRKKYSNDSSKFFFIFRDMVMLPPYKSFDLIFSRDALQHLPNVATTGAINNWVASGSKYLITTFYTKFEPHDPNADISPGDYRDFNPMYPPFNWEDPIEHVRDHHPDDHRALPYQKNMGLWKLPIKTRSGPVTIK